MRIFLGVAAIVAVMPVFARAAPATLPTRDVAVTYRLQGAARESVPGGLPETVRLSWDAGGRRLRVEPEGRQQVLLVDLNAPRAELIDKGMHGVLTLPMRTRDVEPLTLQDATLTPRGRAVVAGLSCTEYDVVAKRGRGVVCLTADGVALRASGTVDGKQGAFTALSVTPGPLPAGSFDVPLGYMHLAFPGFGKSR